VVGTGVELNAQNLNSTGGFTGPRLSGMKKLASHTRHPVTDNAFILSTTRRPRVSLDY
jgi:hypothetical protein